MGLQTFDEKQPYSDFEDITDGWGLTPIVVIGNAQAPVRLDQMYFSSTDTVDREIAIWGMFGSTPQALLGTLNVPAGAGTDSTLPAIDLLSALPWLANGLAFGGSNGIGIAPVVAVSAGKHIYLATFGGTL